MTDDSPYPEIPDDAEGLDRLVEVLAAAPESHIEKSMGLIGAAHREWELAHENDAVPGWADDYSFPEFAKQTKDGFDEVLDRD